MIHYSSRKQVIAGVAFVVLILGGLMFFAGFWKPHSTYRVTSYVTNARGIAQNSTVFEAGLPVGQVTKVKRAGSHAILTLRIDKGIKPLPVDSELSMGVRSLAGETDVLLSPGRSRETVRDGGSLGLSQNRQYTEVDQILTELAGKTRGQARQFFQGLGAGVNGQGRHLNETVGGFAKLVNESPPITSTLGRQHQQVGDIVEHFGSIMDAIRQRTAATQQFLRGTKVTFDAIAARNESFHKLLKDLPFTLNAAESAAHQAALATGIVAPVTHHLSRTMIRLEPSLQALNPAATRGLRLLRALGDSSPALQNVLVNLRKLKPSALKTLPALHSTMCQVNPMARFLAPYGKEIAAFFQNFGGATTAYVPGHHRGHELPTQALVDPSHVFRGVTGQGPEDALNLLFNSGLFKKVTRNKFGYHALPGPGKIAEQELGNGIEGPTEWGKLHKYPHVVADCVK